MKDEKAWHASVHAVATNAGLSESQFSSFQSLSCVQLFVPCQASLSITNSQSLLKLMSRELVIPSNQLILCHPLFLLPSLFPSITVFSNESVLLIRYPKYWSFSINSSVFRFPYSPTLASIPDYWKNDSFNYMDICWQSTVSAF